MLGIFEALWNSNRETENPFMMVSSQATISKAYLLFVPSAQFLYILNKPVPFSTLKHVLAVYGYGQLNNFAFTLYFSAIIPCVDRRLQV
jgi:hypothetical protein